MSGKTGVSVSFPDLSRISPLNWGTVDDTANTLNIPGVRVPVGKPGSGATVQHVQVFSSTRAKTVLGLEFKEKGDTLRDIIASFKEKGW